MHKYQFPDPLTAPKNAPLAYGGNLSIEALLQAYDKGIFPWFSKDEPILWWSPDPRAILEPKNIRVQKSIKSALKKFEIKLDCNYENFLLIFKNEREKKEETWLSDEIIKAYTNLHKIGISHSVEVYENDKLIGGLYGQIFGKVFCGESMISLKPNASKVALIKLCEILEPFGFLIDCQVMNEHLKFMGAVNLARREFLARFNELKVQPSGFDEFGNLL